MYFKVTLEDISISEDVVPKVRHVEWFEKGEGPQIITHKMLSAIYGYNNRFEKIKDNKLHQIPI